MLNDLAGAERGTPFVAVPVDWSPEQLEAVRTRTTADDAEPLVLALDNGWQSFRTPSRPKLPDRAVRPRGYRRGGPRTRRARVTSGPRKARAPGSSEPSGRGKRLERTGSSGSPSPKQPDFIDAAALSLSWGRVA
jgi:hypothetical protein